MTPFEEADARLADMHGYQTAEARNAQSTGAHQFTPRGSGETPAPTSVRKSDVVALREHFERLEEKVDVLAVALDALITAMKAGAVGRWQR